MLHALRASEDAEIEGPRREHRGARCGGSRSTRRTLRARSRTSSRRWRSLPMRMSCPTRMRQEGSSQCRPSTRQRASSSPSSSLRGSKTAPSARSCDRIRIDKGHGGGAEVGRVGLTRARQRLYLTRAELRAELGAQFSPPSRFTKRFPLTLSSGRGRRPRWPRCAHGRTGPPRVLVAWRLNGIRLWGLRQQPGSRQRRYISTGWRRLISIRAAWPGPVRQRRATWASRCDQVTHDEFGLGKVVALEGSGPTPPLRWTLAARE